MTNKELTDLQDTFNGPLFIDEPALDAGLRSGSENIGVGDHSQEYS